MPAPVSKAQARFMGGVASGSINAPGFSKKEAHDSLHKGKGKIGSLPPFSKKKKGHAAAKAVANAMGKGHK